MPRQIHSPIDLRSAPSGGEALAHLASGETFEVLELNGSTAWGIAIKSKLVGYIDAGALTDVGQA